MPTKQEFRDLAQLRLKEAETLFEAGLYDGAAYLCGYAIELAFKARICRLLDTDNYPSGRYNQVYAVHDLSQLRFLAGMENKLDPSNKDLFDNWNIVVPWGVERRYNPVGTVTRQDAEDILDAIRSRPNGVFTW